MAKVNASKQNGNRLNIGSYSEQELLKFLFQLYRENKNGQIVELASSIKDRYPQNSKILDLLAASYSALGYPNQSVSLFKESLNIDPSAAATYYNLGTELNKIEHYNEAIENFKLAIEFHQGFSQAHNNLGLALAGLGRDSEAVESYQIAADLDPHNTEINYNRGLSLLALNNIEEAAHHFKKHNTEKSESYLLRCYYLLNNRELFEAQLQNILDKGFANAIIGAVCGDAGLAFNKSIENPFCSKPMEFILTGDIIAKYAFGKNLLKEINGILTSDLLPFRQQTLLTNGRQTAGNIFSENNKSIKNVERLIHSELAHYKSYFATKSDGIITKWPPKYQLFGWLISFGNGGELEPHIHENGWLSGSIYIYMPEDAVPESGNLVFSTSKQKQKQQATFQKERVLKVETGRVCLFPSSLYHYTTPFQSNEKRVVLAFDIIPS